MYDAKEERKRWIVSRGSPRSVGIRPIRDKGRKGRRRDSGYKHVHEHQFNSSSAILCSARYPITHKALITQLISIYLITPSLPGTISTGPGRESLPPPLSSSPRIPLSLANFSRSAIIRLSLSLAVLSILLANRRHAPAIRIPAECESLASRAHRGLHDSS